MDSGVRPRSPIVRIAQPAERLAGLLPHAPQAPDRQRLEERSDAAGGHHQHAVRLAVVGRELGDELDGATPTEQVTPTSRSTSARIFAAIAAGEPNSDRGARDVQERLVQRDRLHQRRVGAQHLAEPMGVGAVGVEVGRQEDDVGTQAPGPDRRHRRADAVLPRLVGGARRPRRARPVRRPRPVSPRATGPSGPRRTRRRSRCRRAGSARGRVAHPAEPRLECQSRRAGRAGSVGAPMASRKRPSPLARCSAVRSQTSSAMILTPFTPVRRSCPTPPSRRSGRRSSRPWAGPTRRP